MSLLAPGLSARIKGFPNRKPPVLLPFYPSLVAPEWGSFWKNSLGAGPLWENAGLPIDLVSGQLASSVGTTSEWTTTGIGPALNHPNSTQSWVELSLPRLEELTFPFTLIWAGRIVDDGSDGFIFQTQDHADKGTVYAGASIQIKTSGANHEIILQIGDGGGSGSGNRLTFNWVDQLDFDVNIVISVTAKSTTDIDGYKNGILMPDPTTSGTGSGLGTSAIYNGRLGGLQALTYKTHMWAVINGEITARKHFKIARDPFGPFRTHSLPLFLPSVAAAPFDTALLGSSSPRWDRRMRIY